MTAAGACRSIVALTPTGEASRWSLPLVPTLCTGPRDGPTFLFGGVGLAAAVAAMEATTGRPAIWATAQYLSFARPPGVVDIAVTVVTEGRQTTQATALARVGDRPVIAAHAALGRRDDELSMQGPAMPAAPPPAACATVRHWNARDGAVQSLFETRAAAGRFPDGRPIRGPGDGRFLLWIRSRAGHDADARLLSVIGDYLSLAIGDAIGCYADGNSLDNTIRFGAIEETEWMLCDIRIEQVERGVVHGAMHIFSERGRLMATASQSLILRRHPVAPDDGPPRRPNDTPGASI